MPTAINAITIANTAGHADPPRGAGAASAAASFEFAIENACWALSTSFHFAKYLNPHPFKFRRVKAELLVRDRV
jgi:hypothetical protein